MTTAAMATYAYDQIDQPDRPNRLVRVLWFLITG